MKKEDIKYHKGNWFSDYTRFMVRRKAVREQRTFCYCPICKEDLCSNDSFKEDTDLVRYECKNCGCRSSWNFDMPAPMLVRSDEIVYNKDI